MPRRTKEDAMKTRMQILMSALEVIYEKGYSRATLVDIADRIHLTKGAVYWHFKNKQELFIALSQQMEDRIVQGIQHFYSKNIDLGELKQMLVKMILMVHEDPELNKYYAIAYFRMEWTDELSVIKKFFEDQEHELYLFVRQIFENAIKEGQVKTDQGIENYVRSLLSLLDGFYNYSLSHPEKKTDHLSELFRSGFDIFFRGLCSDD